MNRYTPGPWYFSSASSSLTYKSFNIYRLGPLEKQLHIATVNAPFAAPSWERGDDEALANAKLIAAAPEMFEFLCSLPFTESGFPARVAFDAMLARARGIIANVLG